LVLSALFSANLVFLSRSKSLARPMQYGHTSSGTQNFIQERVETMSIEKKSLISTLKTTKKANVAKDDLASHSKSSGLGAPTKFKGLGAPTKAKGLGAPTKAKGLGAPTKAKGLGAPTKAKGLGAPAIKM
jgi:hypothetical protein